MVDPLANVLQTAEGSQGLQTSGVELGCYHQAASG